MEKNLMDLRAILNENKNCPNTNYTRDFDTLKRANLSILRLLESYREEYASNEKEKAEVNDFLKLQIANL